MTYRHPSRRPNPDAAYGALPVLGSLGDPEDMAEDQQPAGTRCTCTGGPYVHGPEGLRLALQEIAATPHPAPQTEREDTDHD